MLLACEGTALGRAGGDARRLLLARMVLDHRLSAHDPLSAGHDDTARIDAVLGDGPVSVERAAALLAA